jgi:DNA phosphorothioation-associated DGQHR protein 1
MSEIKVPCFVLEQPIGEFYIASISSEMLKKFCFTRVADFENEYISGNQRRLNEDRAKEIASYLKTENASIPNSIILSANYDENDNLQVDPDKAWRFEEEEDKGAGVRFGNIIIPDLSLRLCSVIDGQHRLQAFSYSDEEMNLPCSIFLNLPPSLQAYIFSTINFNQQKVDKSLAYQLFGYQLDDSSSSSWSPDMLAVNISRRFNQGGPFKDRIVLIKGGREKTTDWTISSASFIEGVVSLISGNPKKDKYKISRKKFVGHGSRQDLEGGLNYPLRDYYIQGNDKAISNILTRYFEVIKSLLWEGLPPENIVFRAVGISAQFSFLKFLLSEGKISINKDLDFSSVLGKLEGLALTGEYFSPKSATKKRVLDALKLRCEFLKEDEVDAELIKALTI